MANHNEKRKERGFNWPVVIKNANGHANLDYYYGPYDDLSEVPEKMRVTGFTCAVMENGAPVEYWWTGTGWEPKGLPKDTYVKFKGVKDTVDALNDTEADVGDMYIVPVKGSSGAISEYKEYIRANGRWEMLGSRAAGVSGTLSFVNADGRVTTQGANGKDVVTDSYNGTQNVTLDLDMSEYLGKAEAGETYLTKNAASETYLTINAAKGSYATNENVANITKIIVNGVVNGAVKDGALNVKLPDGAAGKLFSANQSEDSLLDLSGLATKTEVASSISEAVTAAGVGDSVLALTSNGDIVKRSTGSLLETKTSLSINGDTVTLGYYLKSQRGKLLWRPNSTAKFVLANPLALVVRYDKDKGASALYNPYGLTFDITKYDGKTGWYHFKHNLGTMDYTISYMGCGVKLGTTKLDDASGVITYYGQSFCTVQSKGMYGMILTTGNNETTDDALWFEVSLYDLRSYAE